MVTMNWHLFLPLATSALVALGGWFIGHRLSTLRDLASRKRELRHKFLLEAYRRLEFAACRGSLNSFPRADDFESAIADIQLLGSPEQVLLANDMAQAITQRKPDASADALLLSLRDELRADLGLRPLSTGLFYFRLKQPDSL